jgi:hypothetical protein
MCISLLCYSSPKSIPGLNPKKTLDKPKLRGILQNTQPVLFITVKVMKNRERLRKDPSLRRKRQDDEMQGMS